MVAANLGSQAVVVPVDSMLSARREFMRTCVKSAAFTVAYLELYVKSCLNMSHAVISAVEHKRRERIRSRNGPLSIRKWIPNLGSPKESLCTSVECLDTMFNMSVYLGKLAGLGPKPGIDNDVKDSDEEDEPAKRQSLVERITLHKDKLEKQL